MTQQDYLKLINADPENVKESEDKSYKFIPISATEAKLDEIYGGEWGFDLHREYFGKRHATGKGVLSVLSPVTGEWIIKSGTAAIPISKEIVLDYPKLEAQVLLSAARKIGRVFGRDLNRDRDDAALPTILIAEDDNTDEELERERDAIQKIGSYEEALAYLQKSPFKYNAALKLIVQSKNIHPPTTNS